MQFKPMKTSKKMKMEKEISSLKTTLKEPVPRSSLKVACGDLSLPLQLQSSPIDGKNVPEKYSKSLFSSASLISATKSSPLGQRHIDSPASTTLNQSFSSRLHAGRFQNAQTNLELDEQLNNEWGKLSEQLLTPRNSSKSQRHISQKEQLSPLSERTLNQSFVSPVHERSLPNSPINDLDSDIQALERRISQEDIHSHSSFSGVTLNNSFVSPIRERSVQRSQIDDLDANSDVQSENLIVNVHEQLKAQNLHRNFLTQQNHNISMQIKNFEWFVREKMEQTELYMKQKLSQFEDSNCIIIDALNDIKNVEREPPVRINENGPGRYVGFSMPKLPVSKSVSLVILNNALKNTQYMEQFVRKIFKHNHSFILFIE